MQKIFCTKKYKKTDTSKRIAKEMNEVKINLPIFTSFFSAIYSATNFTNPEVRPKLARFAIEEKDRIKDHTPNCLTPRLFNKYLYRKKYNIAVNATCIIDEVALIVSFFLVELIQRLNF